jgi:ferredoxin
VPIVTDGESILRRAELQIADISGRIMDRRNGRHHVARRLFTTAMSPMYSRMRESCMKSLRELAGEPPDSTLGFRELMPRTDASIRVDDSCTDCGVCVRVCPVGNIELVDGRPVRRHRCEMCFACDEWCPRGAVHHWGRPDGAKYHYPGVKARDLYKEPVPG